MDADAYRHQIDSAIRELSGEIILNGSHAHASIIVERMFAHAKECVLILTRRLDPRIYGTSDLLEQAKLYLGEPERKCHIIVEEIDEVSLSSHPMVDSLGPYFEAGNIQIRKLKPNLAELINLNYSVIDRVGFRFEEDKETAVAVASFGEGRERFVNSLRGLFERLWSDSTAIQMLGRAHQVSL